MRPKKNLMFVIPSLAGGGAERTLVHLLNHLDEIATGARDGNPDHPVLRKKGGGPVIVGMGRMLARLRTRL